MKTIEFKVNHLDDIQNVADWIEQNGCPTFDNEQIFSNPFHGFLYAAESIGIEYVDEELFAEQSTRISDTQSVWERSILIPDKYYKICGKYYHIFSAKEED